MRKETYLRISGNDRGIAPTQPKNIATAEVHDAAYPVFTDMRPKDVLYGRQVEQWLCGLVGAICTTLPSFILMPMWFLFTNKTKVQKRDGKVDCAVCFAINFIGGVAIWTIAIIIFSL